MKRVLLVFAPALVFLPWLAGARAQAEPIRWSLSGVSIGSEVVESRNFDLNGTIGIGYTTWQSPIIGTFSESVAIATLRTFSVAPAQDTLLFGGPSGNYSLNLALTDLASGASGSLTFRGNLSGTVSLNQVDLTNTFLGPTTQTLTLGGHQYTVTIGPFVPPGPLTRNYSYVGTPTYFSEPDGSISVTVQVTTPEPSSLMLACLGLPLFGLSRWFRRKNSTQVSSSRLIPRTRAAHPAVL
ncbi:MAG TPA: PEP-CTERM sorting domain-containing protein [Gemmataceae bacterium]|nr:PEP-CTERM sorting domain-containing protein [Gemmataceae bacterium]